MARVSSASAWRAAALRILLILCLVALVSVTVIAAIHLWLGPGNGS